MIFEKLHMQRVLSGQRLNATFLHLAAFVLHVPATGLIHTYLLQFQLFSYYPVHFVSHFNYGHESCPQIIFHIVY